MTLNKLWLCSLIHIAFPQPNLGHCRESSLTKPMLITVFQHWFRSEGHRESRNGVGSQSPAERQVGLEPRTLRFWMWHLNPLCHSPLFLYSPRPSKHKPQQQPRDILITWSFSCRFWSNLFLKQRYKILLFCERCDLQVTWGLTYNTSNDKDFCFRPANIWLDSWLSKVQFFALTIFFDIKNLLIRLDDFLLLFLDL